MASALNTRSGRVQVLARDHLVAALGMIPDSGVGLICAPSGYGKSTLLISWAQNRPLDALLMVQLREGDDDSVVLADRIWVAWRAMLAGPRGVGCSGQSHEQPDSMEGVLTSLASHARDCPRLHVLILDDVQRISDPTVIALLATLVENPVAGWATVLSSREDPPLSLMTVRSRGVLTELRSADLALDTGEIRQVLTREWQLDISDTLVEDLRVTTGGWLAGVRIAAGEMDASAHPADVTALVANRHVAGFFDTEVVKKVDPELTGFLETTSVLDHMYPTLCDVLTGRTDSYEVLEDLVARGLFSEKRTDQPTAFTYHPLLRELLETRLRDRDPGRRTAALRAASDWCEEQHYPSEAIEYACRAEDWVRARSIVVTHSGKTLHSGKVTTIAAWIDAFPEEIRRSDIVLSLLEAKAYLILFDRGRCRWAMRQASRLLQATPAEADLDAPLGSGAEIAWRFLLANDLLVRGRLDSIVGPLEEAVALDEGQSAPDETQQSLAVTRPSLQSALAAGLLLAGKTTEAIGFADLMLDSPADPGSLPLVRALGTKALAHAWGGDEGTARDLAEEGLSWLGRVDTEANDPFLVHLAVAWTADVGTTRSQSLSFTRTLARRSGLASFEALALLAAARNALAADNVAAAERALDAASESVESLEEPGVLPSLATQVSRELDAYRERQSPIELTAREREILRHISTGLTRQQVADALHLSLDTVKTYLRRAYRKLGVDNRDAAVARAVEDGLLARNGPDGPPPRDFRT